MGKVPGRPKGLVDMSIPPQPDPEYQLPPPEECEEFDGSMVLAPLNELRTRFVIWNDKYMVEFAVVQIARLQGAWVEIAKIDTAHAVVHRHQHVRNGASIVRELERIPVEQGWEVVDRWYERALGMLETEWKDNVRSWSDDS